MESKPLYNSRIIRSYFEYLNVHYPEIDIYSILKESEIGAQEVADQGHWFTQEQINKFQKVLSEKTNNPSLAREAGRYLASAKGSSIIRQYFIGFLTPITAYRVLEKASATISHHVNIQTRKINDCSVELTVFTKPGVKEGPFQCENRQGMFEGLATVFTKNYATVEHTSCIHRGDKCCRYIVSWEKVSFVLWKQLSRYVSLASAIATGGLFFLLPTSYWIMVLLALLLASSLVFLNAERLQKINYATKVTTQGDIANQLINQINRRYNDALLVQEIGQALSRILDIDQLLLHFMNILQKRLDFDRGLVMLANNERTHLIYKAGYGYDTEEGAYLRQTAFNLDKPGSKGAFVVSFREQRPFLIDNVDEFKNSLSPKTLQFIERIQAQSFICVPIVHEGKSEGVLAVDNILSNKQLTQSDANLLMGIAPQIGIFLHNARMYEKIRENEEWFRAISENAPDIIYALSREGSLTYVNSAWEEILGYPQNTVLNQPFTNFILEEDLNSYTETFRRIKDNQETVRNTTFTLRDIHNSPRLFSFNGAPNTNDRGTVTGIVGTLKDITEQRNLENQLQHASKMEAIGTLTGGIAHDFNNIIQAIGSYVELLMMRKADQDPDFRYLANVNSLTRRATDLIQELMLFSRKVESKLHPVDLNDEITNLYELLSNTIPKMISIKLNLENDLAFINGDHSQLGQVIMNLAVNARDAMPEGGILEIMTKNVYVNKNIWPDGNEIIKEGAYAMIGVRDTGCGMHQDTVEHIFEPFFTTKPAGKGTGLGLSVVYGIVKNHSGYIVCESEQRKGTTFKIYLPALEIHGEAPRIAETAKAAATAGEGTILLVDDEVSLLETGRDILNHYGYTTLSASSGEGAIEIYKKEGSKIDIIMLDLIMPGMGGERCLSELRQIDPEIRVIVTSGYSANFQIDGRFDKTITFFLNKPYRIDDLINSIQTALATRPISSIQ
ncbi:MAG: PAS domain S-box protein [Deltaproteobacteria bacterium]|nr:PAS domain S-box protein [Deltaproteobacteria bacterium]